MEYSYQVKDLAKYLKFAIADSYWKCHNLQFTESIEDAIWESRKISYDIQKNEKTIFSDFAKELLKRARAEMKNNSPGENCSLVTALLNKYETEWWDGMYHESDIDFIKIARSYCFDKKTVESISLDDGLDQTTIYRTISKVSIRLAKFIYADMVYLIKKYPSCAQIAVDSIK